MVSQVFDWFGTGVRFTNTTDTSTEVILNVNEQAMLHWALMFSDAVEILEPASLRAKIRATHKDGLQKYSSLR
jgi:predicted DNA-binding transcriptional regulator YafY